MENSHHTSSVIAKLMCLDEPPPLKQPDSRQYRVFSENYLQKSGSIGKRSRKDLQNNLSRSKKMASLRTNYSNKDILSRDFEQKNLLKPESELKDAASISPAKTIVLKPNLINLQHAPSSRYSLLLNSQTTFGWEAKKQLLERLKMTKVSQSHSLGEMFSLKKAKSKPELKFGSLLGVSSKEGWKYESVTKLPSFKLKNFSSNSTPISGKITRSDVKQSSGELLNDMSTNTKNNNLVSNSPIPFSLSSNSDADGESFYSDTEDKSNLSAKEGCSSSISDLSSEQDSLIGTHDASSISSNCLQTDEEHPGSRVDAYQHSPNSVLQPPYGEDNSSSSEYFESASTNLHGLWMQLQLLNSESEENDIDPEMVTSSDDEISSCTGQNIKSMISFGAKEGRDFSYLVDVLDESVFDGGNVEISFERWHSSECMASPLVFETLEKKYGKQEMWHKAERRLLFDCINAGMTEVFRPRIDICVCSKPLRRKMRSMLRRDVIEEELATLLLGHEKGVHDGVSEKAVGRGLWLAPVDELDSLVREIETFLFNELAAELVCA